jgi:hypothetical protein
MGVHALMAENVSKYLEKQMNILTNNFFIDNIRV